VHMHDLQPHGGQRATSNHHTPCRKLATAACTAIHNGCAHMNVEHISSVCCPTQHTATAGVLSGVRTPAYGVHAIQNTCQHGPAAACAKCSHTQDGTEPRRWAWEAEGKGMCTSNLNRQPTSPPCLAALPVLWQHCTWTTCVRSRSGEDCTGRLSSTNVGRQPPHADHCCITAFVSA